jgi:hypothetical protein
MQQEATRLATLMRMNKENLPRTNSLVRCPPIVYGIIARTTGQMVLVDSGNRRLVEYYVNARGGRRSGKFFRQAFISTGVQSSGEEGLVIIDLSDITWKWHNTGG